MSDAAEIHPAYKVSGLARPVDPAYPTNKALSMILPVLLLGGVVWTWWGGGTWLEVAIGGFNLALVGFFVWAMTREMAPDDNPAAFIALVLAALTWTRMGSLSFLLLAGAMGPARVVNRSTGRGTELTDTAAAVALGGLLSWGVHWSVGIAATLGFVFDAFLPAPTRNDRQSRHLVAAGLVGASTLVQVLASPPEFRLPPHLPIFGTVALLGWIVTLACPTPRSVGDVDGLPLSRNRVRLGTALIMLVATLTAVDANYVMEPSGALWAAVAGMVLGFPVMLLRRRPSASA